MGHDPFAPSLIDLGFLGYIWSAARCMQAILKYTINLASFKEADLDALPFGIIHLNENGMVLDYNSYEAGLAHLHKQQVVGKNFFAHIAPCTHVPEFYGRFEEGVKNGTLNEHFDFEFPFPQGTRHVFVQMLGDPTTKSAWIFVADASQAIKIRLDENRMVTFWRVSGQADPIKMSDA
jgi:photoactive yellow protein